ncbi:MAG: hypothetical protein WCL57_01990, partial [Chloroflexota bacterium]
MSEQPNALSTGLTLRNTPVPMRPGYIPASNRPQDNQAAAQPAASNASSAQAAHISPVTPAKPPEKPVTPT